METLGCKLSGRKKNLKINAFCTHRRLMGPGPESIIKPCGKKEYFNRKNHKNALVLHFLERDLKEFKKYTVQGMKIEGYLN
jgi:hypothetical protein